MNPLTGMQPESPRWSAFDTILVVEDDEDTREMFVICIESETSYHVLSLSSAEEVLQHLQEIQEAKPRLFIIDYHLITRTGIELYDSLQRVASNSFIEFPSDTKASQH